MNSKFRRKIRQAVEGDLPFIASSWMKSFCRLMEPFGVNSNWLTFAQRSLIDWILQRSTVLVACNADSPSHILGYICVSCAKQHLLVHWGYTKSDFRSDRIFSDLLDEARRLAGPTEGEYFTFSINPRFDKAISSKFDIRCKSGALNWINIRGK